jgi:hypothetical protein
VARLEGALVAGAYGWRVVSQLAPESLAVLGAEGWPELHVSFAAVPTPGADDIVMEQGPGGKVFIDRAGLHAVVPHPPGAPLDELVHPGLTAAAWLAARVRGDEVMHAGAYVHDDGAWIVIGDHEGGKSTTLALLLAMGVEILADDMVVIRAGRACAGPRCLDLRPEAGARLEVGVPVREEFKRRVSLPPIRAEYPIRGFVHLAWSEGLACERLRPAERMARLLEHTGQPPRRRPAEILQLSALPHFLLSRAQDWETATRSAELLIETLHTAVAGSP